MRPSRREVFRAARRGRGRTRAALRGRARPNTGSGIWAIQLAKRGWQVTGVDLVEKALAASGRPGQGGGGGCRYARTRRRYGARVRAGIGSDFRLLLDTGTFHGLKDHQREGDGPGSGLGRCTRMQPFSCSRGRDDGRPLIRGVDQSEIEEAFPGWTVTNVGASHFQAPKPIEVLLSPTNTGIDFVARGESRERGPGVLRYPTPAAHDGSRQTRPGRHAETRARSARQH